LLPDNNSSGWNDHNYQNLYLNGVKIHYTSAAMRKHGEKMKEYLSNSLTEIERLVPSDAWNIMKTTEIYVNDEYFYDGVKDRGAGVHWSSGWLEANGNIAEKEGHIEINDIGDLLTWDQGQAPVILHEMAHAYHWRRDHNGSRISPYLEETYKKAMAGHKYDSTQHRDGRFTKHYAATNYFEYFAEVT